jgi:antitoxin ParD1/3/4
MHLDLTGELERFVQEKVASGQFDSAVEVVQEALQLLARHDDKLVSENAELCRKLDEGLAALERGDSVDGHEFFAELEQREKQLERGLQPG